MKWLAALAVLLGWLSPSMTDALNHGVSFSNSEIRIILSHGPSWPPNLAPDPSNRVSGDPAAIALGRQLFADPRLSRGHNRSCATCHEPNRAFTDGLARSIGIARLDRNAPSLFNLRLNRWFGWAGKSDNLWAQSLHPIVDRRELGASADLVAERIAADSALATAYQNVFGSQATTDPPETVLVNVAKALAAFQETLTSGKTPFDHFRDALAAGDRDALARYPLGAQRGLRLFIGKGQCRFCHFGPNFTNGEFHDIGMPYFIDKDRVDPGRYGGIKAVKSSRFNLLGPYNDDESRSTAGPTRHVALLHRNWGEFRIPSLRNVALTAPYMHDGSLATLADVVRHYSELNEDRLHAEGERLLRALRLTPGEIDDLVMFLRSLSVVGHGIQ
ncbi:MAG: hypothetical protein ETSY2_14905 [Candidatus Entotheonella gemina]|uniref:Cytochrome c domain-containing protein n=1 Tax=Candidatus Entotheonella gemina TaxID=1429439 RepID=W4M9H3_9BACT|nr:MAG: hypothetical protein ETSY2_14905 [Candidatus Entotheonella gemina]